MNDSKNQSEGPTAGQLANGGNMVSGAFIRILVKSNITGAQLKNFTQEDANQLGEKIFTEWFKIQEEKWFDQKKHISLFWKKFFSIDINWSKVAIKMFDPKFKRLEYVVAKVTCQQILDAYAKAYGKDSTWKYWNKELDEVIKSQQERPSGDYVFAHVGDIEPDKEHLGKSYDDATNENLNFMILKEGLIAAFRYRFETGKMLDVKGVTRLATLDFDGDALYMYRGSNGRFYIGRGDRGNRYSDRGPRELDF